MMTISKQGLPSVRLWACAGLCLLVFMDVMMRITDIFLIQNERDLDIAGRPTATLNASASFSFYHYLNLNTSVKLRGGRGFKCACP